MKNLLRIGKTQAAFEQSFKVATKLKGELPTKKEMESVPLMEPSSLAEYIHVEARGAPQNTDLDMREFLGINEDLHSIRGNLVNNGSNLTKIDKTHKQR